MAQSETREIRGQKITISQRSKTSWITYHRFRDEYGNLKSQESKTLGKKAGVTNIDQAFAAAYQWIVDTQGSIDSGKIAQNTITFGKYIDEFWEPSRPKTATYDRYSLQLSKPELANIKKMKIGSINYRVLTETFKKIAETPTERTGKIPSTASLYNYKKALSNVFQAAVKDNVIDVNPTHGLELGRYVSAEQKRKENAERLEKRNSFSHEDIEKILAYIKPRDTQLYYLVRVMVQTGLRTQEILALDSNHSVNWQEDCLVIDQAIENVKGKGVQLKSTKTGNPRIVYFNEDVRDALKAQIALKREQLDKLMTTEELESAEHLFIFSSHRQYPNRLYRREVVSKRFKNFIKEIDVPEYDLYALRHTYANWMLDKKVMPETIAQQMGHDIQTFYRYYVHELSDLKREAGRIKLL